MPAADDKAWMQMALRLAARGRGRTSPNPMVGSVIVKDGSLAGAGWHHRAGEPHAEVLALREAGERSAGATVFVTLEPCAHHGRTPPCVESLVAAGVARVVVAMEDPDPRTAGKGVDALRGAGIQVDVGLLEDRARRLNEQYIVHRTAGRPFVTYKAGLSLDGRTAAQDGSSRWITSEAARRDAHRLRAHSDAICAGIGTVLTDDPQLTARGARRAGTPLRIVVDSEARTPLGSRVLSREAPTIVFTSTDDGDARCTALKEAGAEIVCAPEAGGRVSLPDMLRNLAGRGVVSLLLEGGATLAGSFAAQGLVDRYVFYLAPKLIGSTGAGTLNGWTALSIADAMDLRIDQARRVGPDLRVVAYPERRSG